MNNTQMENQVLQVPIEDILPNRFQPRLSFDDSQLDDLAASIKEHGIIQPLVLRRKNDKYEIIAGERRFKASKMAGLTSVPAIISNLDDNASAEVAIVENIQRKDLTSIEEARSYQALLDKGYMTQEELARKMGISQSAISNKLRLLTLDDAVQEAVLNEKISERHARALLKVASHDKQKELLNKIVSERLTVKQLEDEIKRVDANNNAPVVEALFAEPASVNTVCDKVSEKVDDDQNLDDIFTNVLNLNDVSFMDNVEPVKEVYQTTPEDYFSNTDKIPNKFFNFLEDSAVNMDTDEVAPVFEVSKVESDTSGERLINNTDDIEMLDEVNVPDSKEMGDNYVDDVIKKVRELHLDNDKVVVEEMNLPLEYHISIVIKKS